MAWKLLLGYLPTNQSRRTTTLIRKRAEYKDAMAQHYDIDDNSRTLQEQETLRQVLVDVPRTAPEIPLFRNERIKRTLGRLLYIWAMRHPASSYVQGINDLATPLFAVFLSDYYNGEDVMDGNVMVVISEERLEEVSRLDGWRWRSNTFTNTMVMSRNPCFCVAGRSRCLLVLDEHSRGYPRSLYGGPTRCTTNGDAARGSCSPD